MKYIIRFDVLGLLSGLILSAILLAPAYADTALTQWSITATTGGTNTNAPANYSSGFVSSQIIGTNNSLSNSNNSGLLAGNSSSPSGTWNRTYTNSVNPFPANGLASIAVSDYFSFTSTILPGWNINVDSISGLKLSRTSAGPPNAALYYSTNNGTSWLQAGGTATFSNSITDVSSLVNTGTGTNTYVNGGVTNIITNSGLTTSPIDFNNVSGLSSLTVDWALAVWGGGNGRVGIANGGNNLTLSGNILTSAIGNQYWTAGTNGTWDTTSVNWSNSKTSSADMFASGDNATFTNVADTAITVTSGGVTMGTLTNSGGNLTLGGGTLTGSGIVQNGSKTLTINTSTSLTGGLVISSGTVLANVSNAVTGGSTINGGTLIDPLAGSVSGALSLNSGGTFDINSSSTETNVGSSIAVGSGGGTISVDGTNAVTFSNTVTGPSNALTTAGSGTIIFTKTLGANKNGLVLDVNSNSSVILANPIPTGTNDLAGGIISGSLTTLTNVLAIEPSTTLSGVGTLTVNGTTVLTTFNSNAPGQIGTISCPVFLASGSSNNFNGSASGNNLVISGTISGSGQLTANMGSPSSKLTLSGSNTYTGPTWINEGILSVTGSNVSAVTMNGTYGVLQSSTGLVGTVGSLVINTASQGNLNVGGGSFVLGSGTAPTNTTTAGGLLISGGASFATSTGIANNLIFTFTNTVNPVTDYSQLTVGGQLNYGGAAMYIDLNNTNSAFVWTNASLQLIQPNGGVTGDLSTVAFDDYTGSSTNVVSLVESNAGSGIWSGLDGTNTVLFNDTTGVLALNGGSVPEPSTCALLGLGLTAFALVMIRRRPTES